VVLEDLGDPPQHPESLLDPVDLLAQVDQVGLVGLVDLRVPLVSLLDPEDLLDPVVLVGLGALGVQLFQDLDNLAALADLEDRQLLQDSQEDLGVLMVPVVLVVREVLVGTEMELA